MLPYIYIYSIHGSYGWVMLMHFGAETISSRFLHQWSCNNLGGFFLRVWSVMNTANMKPREAKPKTILKVNAWLSDVMLCKPRMSWHVFKERVTSWRQRLENYLGRATLFGFLLAPANRPNSIWTHIRLEVWSVLWVFNKNEMTRVTLSGLFNIATENHDE